MTTKPFTVDQMKDLQRTFFIGEADCASLLATAEKAALADEALALLESFRHSDKGLRAQLAAAEQKVKELEANNATISARCLQLVNALIGVRLQVHDHEHHDGGFPICAQCDREYDQQIAAGAAELAKVESETRARIREGLAALGTRELPWTWNGETTVIRLADALALVEKPEVKP